jgi:hypothetical protein
MIKEGEQIIWMTCSPSFSESIRRLDVGMIGHGRESLQGYIGKYSSYGKNGI